MTSLDIILTYDRLIFNYLLGLHRYESAFYAKYQLLDIAAVLDVFPLDSERLGANNLASKRSEPSSRAALMGEQPNPWDRLQPQDATSRHRGAKPPRRCGLLGEISLLSPG